MNRKVEKKPPTAVSVATAAVVATRTLSSKSTTKPGSKQDIPKSHPKTLDIPGTPSKAGTNTTLPKGEKRLYSSTSGAAATTQKAVSHSHHHPPQHDGKEQQKSPPAGILPSQFASICREVSQIRDEHVAIRKTLSEKEGELGKTRVALRSIAEERDFLRNKVSELEHMLKHSPEMYSEVATVLSTGNGSNFVKSALQKSPTQSSEESAAPIPNESPLKSGSRNPLNDDAGRGAATFMPSVSSPTPTPHINSQESHQPNNNNKNLQQQKHGEPTSQNKKSSHHENNRSVYYSELQQHPHLEFHHGNSRNEKGNNITSMTKSNNNNHGGTRGGVFYQQQHHLSQSGITGLDLMLLGPDCSTKVVEHLVHPVAIESSIREIQHTLVLRGVPLNGDRLREVEIEIDRLNSRIDHLRSQNDVLTLNLEDAKSHADRLTVLLGKYESNNVALQMALRYSNQMADAYEMLVALLETELGQVLANIHAAGHLHSIVPPVIKTAGGGVSSGSGNNNNSNDNSPSEVLATSPSAQVATNGNGNIPIPAEDSKSPTTTPQVDVPNSGNNNSHEESQVNNNNSMMPVKSHDKVVDISTTTCLPSPPSGKHYLVEQANKNRLVAERAARFLLSRYWEQSSPLGSENNNFSRSPHPLVTNLSRDSNSSTSNLSNFSGESSHSLSPFGDEDNRHHHHDEEKQSSAIIGDEEESAEVDNGKSRSSSGTPTTSTLRAPYSPNGNCINGCSTVITSMLPFFGHHGNATKRTAVEPSIRHLISTLKGNRDAVKQTVMELERGSLESLTPCSKPSSPYSPSSCWSPADARKLDLETAVLMQELMAMKEERAELRAQQFLLEKEKASLELTLRSYESQEEAYKARINYLKSEIMDCKSLHSESYQDRNRNDIMNSPQRQQEQQQHHPTQNNGNNRNLVETINNNNNNQNVNWERESLLKKRMHELASTLETVTVGSQQREKQNQEMINELNRANGILMQTLDVAKKKYQTRVKKMEEQVLYISERHASQLRLFGERMPTLAKHQA